MDWLVIFGIAVGLAMDAFAVSIAAGIRVAPVTGRHLFRLSFHFGLFQFMMPVIGAMVGRSVASYFGSSGHWVAAGLLAIIGGKMIYDACFVDGDEQQRSDPTRGMTLVALSIATSIDALAVGLGMALVGSHVLLPSIIIGLVCAALSYFGARFGSMIGSRGGHLAEILGGLILIAIGVKLLIV